MFAFSVKRFSVTDIIQLTPTIRNTFTKNTIKYYYLTTEHLENPRSI